MILLPLLKTKLDEICTDTQIKINNVKLHRKDVTSQSDGVMVYVRPDIPQSRRNHINGDDDHVQKVTYDVVLKHDK